MFTDLITGMGRKVREFNSANMGIKQNDVSDLTDIFEDLAYSWDSINHWKRWEVTRRFLTKLNARDRFGEIITYYLSPSNLRLLGCKESTKDLILNTVNEYLKDDGYRVTITTKGVQIKEISGESPVQVIDFINIDDDGIKRELKSCDEAIQDKQFRTAVTSARTLLEATLGHIDRNLSGASDENVKNYELPRLYKQVTKKLHYYPTAELEGSFKKIGSGMLTCLQGIIEIRNEAGTAHAPKTSQIPIERHHALLVVNAAKTIILFLWQVYKKQKNMPSKSDQENTT